MARPLRLDLLRRFYHVLNRGVERRFILKDDADHRKFIELLGETDHTPSTALDTKLTDLPDFMDLSIRTRNSLRNDNILTIEDLVRYTGATLRRVPNLGRKSVDEVKRFLTVHGRSLGELPREPHAVAS